MDEDENFGGQRRCIKLFVQFVLGKWMIIVIFAQIVE